MAEYEVDADAAEDDDDFGMWVIGCAQASWVEPGLGCRTPTVARGSNDGSSS